jgi:hypothetical protein
VCVGVCVRVCVGVCVRGAGVGGGMIMWDAMSSGIRDNRFRDSRIRSYLKTYFIQKCLTFLFAKLINGVKYVLSLCIPCCFVNLDILTVKTNSRENNMLKSDTLIQGLFLSLSVHVRLCVCVNA